MTRFLQQRIKPMISRFIPKALCPSCGESFLLNSDKKVSKKRDLSEKKKIKNVQQTDTKDVASSLKTSKNKKK